MNVNELNYLNLRVCGIDPHKRFFKAVIVDMNTLNTLYESNFPNNKSGVTELEAKLREYRCNLVVVENTNNFSSALYYYLKRHNFDVKSVSPKNVPQKPKKSDRIDAKWIAIVYAKGLVEEDYVPPEDIQHLRDLVRARERLVDMRTALKNRVHTLLTRGALHLNKLYSDIFGKKGREAINAIVSSNLDDVDERVSQVIGDAFLELINKRVMNLFMGLIEILLDRRIKELEEVIAAYVDTHSSIKAMVERIMTIPGISLVTAAIIVAEVGDFTRFPDKKQISGWAGIVPRTRESAGVQRGYGITKRGSPYLRHALHEVANVIILRKEPKELYAFYWRVRRRSGKYKAITALAHKVLIVLWGMMTTGSNFEMDSNMRRLYNRKLKRFNNMAELGKRVLLEVT